MEKFDLRRFLVDVFEMEEGETVGIINDLPPKSEVDLEPWQERQKMAEEWHRVLFGLAWERNFNLLPIFHYPATGVPNADLPEEAINFLRNCTLALAINCYSATAPLFAIEKEKTDFRAASMPGIDRRMEQTGLSADLKELQRRCEILLPLMAEAEGCAVIFLVPPSQEFKMFFDLRENLRKSNKAGADSGYLPRGKLGHRVINLPGGEVYKVPLEESWSETNGIIPIWKENELTLLQVEQNKVKEVKNKGLQPLRWEKFFKTDIARLNIAECAFGCNPCATIINKILQDEKVPGFHLAFGRSEHLGGLISPECFQNEKNVTHLDVVYPEGRDRPIIVKRATLVSKGSNITVIQDGRHLLF